MLQSPHLYIIRQIPDEFSEYTVHILSVKKFSLCCLWFCVPKQNMSFPERIGFYLFHDMHLSSALTIPVLSSTITCIQKVKYGSYWCYSFSITSQTSTQTSRAHVLYPRSLTTQIWCLPKGTKYRVLVS